MSPITPGKYLPTSTKEKVIFLAKYLAPKMSVLMRCMAARQI